jgi:hypothetical protein
LLAVVVVVVIEVWSGLVFAAEGESGALFIYFEVHTNTNCKNASRSTGFN